MVAHVKEVTGIALDETKGYLLESRLRPLLKSFGMTSYAELSFAAKKRPDVNAALIDAITTNETYFFRDKHPFELFKGKLIPDLLSQNSQARVHVASAACSSGQEAYSMAIVLKQILFDPKKYNVQITGFDISDEAVARASKGEYSSFEVSRGLTSAMVSQHFTQEGNNYRINDELRAIVSFRMMNLLRSPLGMQQFDIIFCRNVANYFVPKDRTMLFDRLADGLVRDGVLVIGGTESLTGISDRFQRNEFHGSVFYRKMR